jgi:hypothetical protein
MKSRDRQQIGLKPSPLIAEKLVEFLVAIFPRGKAVGGAMISWPIFKACLVPPHGASAAAGSA